MYKSIKEIYRHIEISMPKQSKNQIQEVFDAYIGTAESIDEFNEHEKNINGPLD